jgi:peptidoglycan/LPS O-acetylase OafA/YrhL
VQQTLGDALTERRNALTCIRLGLAAVVLVAHAASLSGLAEHPLVGGVGIGTWAVMGFFTISGYLVSQSRERLTLPRFAVHRAARILPAFWAANVLTAAVGAPVAAWAAGTSVDVRSAIAYPLRNVALVMTQWSIDGTLANAPYTDVWNGSLWTLAQEAGWYVLVGVALLLVAWRRNLVAASCLLLVAMSAMNVVGIQVAVLGAFFAAGMVIYSVRGGVPVSLGWCIAGVLVLVAASWSGHVVLLAPLPLGYVLLAASTCRVPGLSLATDLSYGLYLYAFPVSQVLAQLGVQTTGLFPFTVATGAIAMAFAWMSWVLVESRSLAAVRALDRRLDDRAAVDDREPEAVAAVLSSVGRWS